MAAAGYAALCVQALLLRELMVAWRGNEMSFGLALAVWLSSAGAGGAAYGMVSRRSRPTPRGLGTLLAALGLLAPAALIAARFTRLALGAPAGELAGIPQLLSAAAFSVAPFALLSGFVFSYSISVIASRERTDAAAVARAYILEAVGAVVAGALMSFILLQHVSPIGIAFLAAGLCCLASALLCTPEGPSLRRVAAAPLALTITAIAFVVAAGRVSDRIDGETVAAQWRSYGFLSQRNSVYGRVVTTETDGQESVFESGVLVASHPDRMAAEESVHVTMLQHRRPERVLLVGGCLGGSVAEILKHPDVKSVDCVELDPVLISEARRQFGATMTEGLADPRVTVRYGDARFFVKRAKGPYDVMIVSVPDPTTARLNRFYTLEFFEEARAVLAPDGVLGLTLSSAENYVSDEMADVLACVANTLSRVFDEVLLTPGDPCHILAAGPGTGLTRDPATLSERVASRALDLVYVRDYYIMDRFSRLRAADLDEALARSAPPLNTDLKPSCYYLSLLAWDRQLSGHRGALARLSTYVTLRNSLIAAAVLAAMGVLPLARPSTRRTLRGPVFLSVFVVGFSEISLEIASLLAYQSLYGFVYDRVAVLVAAFMAGLAGGGWLGMRAVRRGAGVGTYLAIQAAIALVPLGLWKAVETVAGLDAERLAPWSNAFPLLVVAAAFLAGTQFPLAARLCVRSGEEPGAVGGRLYGADLAGAAVGAVATSVLLLPVLGLKGAMTALSILNAGVLAALAVSASRTRSAG